MITSASARPDARVLEWLTHHEVDHEVHEHSATYSATSTARADGIDPRAFAKVVGVATSDGRTALLVVDASARVDLQKARDVVSAAEVKLLDEAQLATLAPDCETGAMPAIGALYGLPMYADYVIKDDAQISFNAGTHRCSVRVDRPGWERAAGVHYGDLVLDTDERTARASS
jgi:Ala-tRNA(Pro) deacylase